MTLQKFIKTYQDKASLQTILLAYGFTLRGYRNGAAFQLAEDAEKHQTQVTIGDKFYELTALSEKELQYLVAQVEKRGGLDVSDGFGQYHLERMMWQQGTSFSVICK